MAKSKKFENLQANIQAKLDREKIEQKRDLFKQRLAVARQGMTAFEANQHGLALKNFLTYLRILEDSKDVKEGGLSPSNFDQKKDMAEMLLISGVFWSLAKIYDQTKNKKHAGELEKSLNKFHLFSKGQTFEPLSREMLRKYMVGKAQNTGVFKAAYIKFGGKTCFVLHSLGDEISQKDYEFLRNFRDTALVKSRIGLWFVDSYYELGPKWALSVKKFPSEIKWGMALIVRLIISSLKLFRF